MKPLFRNSAFIHQFLHRLIEFQREGCHTHINTCHHRTVGSLFKVFSYKMKIDQLFNISPVCNHDAIEPPFIAKQFRDEFIRSVNGYAVNSAAIEHHSFDACTNSSLEWRPM